MTSRPRIRPEFSAADRILEIAGWAVLLIFWIFTVNGFMTLPDVIPTHFDAAGHPDNTGHKITILIIPVAATILYSGMTLLNRYPHIFNFVVGITEENALRQYRIATRMIRYLKFILVIIFFYIAWIMQSVATGISPGLGIWFVPVTMVLVFVPLIFFIVQSIRMK